MKKIRQIITMLFTGALILTLASCDLLSKMGEGLKEDFEKWWGNSAQEQAERSCGIPHFMTASGKLTYNEIDCAYIELDPTIGQRGQFTSYIKKDGEPVYRGKFFYKENVDDVEKGDFFIYVEWVWLKDDNKWTTPGAFTNLKYNDDSKPYFKAENVNLTTQATDTIDATKQITYEEYEEEYDAMVKSILQKHSGTSNTAGIERNNIFDPDEREDRFGFIERFENALNGHSSSSTSVSYEKVNGVYTYIATIDDQELELMVFSDGELFFYPYDGNDRTYMLGMYSYNQASYYDDEGHLDYTKNKAARKWIRENYTNICSLYDELSDKAATAKADAKAKAKEEYEASQQ
jgi:hypothetical protein